MLRPKWETLLRKYFNVFLPDDYITFDLETTGFKKDDDLPVDFGWCLVDDRRITQRGNFILDWTRTPKWVDLDWLVYKLNRVREAYRAKGIDWNYTPKRLREEGHDPAWVLNFAHDLLEASFKSDRKVIGQNICAYDCPLLSFVFNEYLDSPWPVPDSGILDTGCLEKASLTYDHLNPIYHLNPNQGETPAEFFKRCFNKRVAGAKWNLDACVHRYELEKLYGFNPGHTHGADVDSYACFLLTELNREETDHAKIAEAVAAAATVYSHRPG